MVGGLSQNSSSAWAFSLVGFMKNLVENLAQRERKLRPDRLSRGGELRQYARGMRLKALVEILSISELLERTRDLGHEAETRRSTIRPRTSTRTCSAGSRPTVTSR